ncbi:unnamed protein product, partial [Rotaria sp. Silwood2]
NKLAGPMEAKLLEIQGIRSAYSLVNTEDIFDILKYESKASDDIRKNICLLVDDNRYIVKPGCKSNLRYLTQLLIFKNEEHLKTIGARLKSKNKSNDDSINDISQSQTTAQVRLISSPLEQNTTTTKG